MNNFKEIPNTRHIPQPNRYDDIIGSRGTIPNTTTGGQRGYESLIVKPGSGPIPNTSDPILDMIDQINSDYGMGDATDAKGNKILTGDDKYLKELGMLQGLNTHFAHQNKWVGYFPISNVLGKKYSNLELNLTRFSIPQIVMGSTTTSFKGYQYEIPTKVLDADTKNIVIEYLIDEKWQNYKALAKWCSATEGQINQVTTTGDVNTIAMTDFIDCRIWLLDSFKNRIIDFVFENCWIKSFQDLSLEANNPGEVPHTITLAYSNFYIDDAKNK